MDTLNFKIIKNDNLIIDGINFSKSIFIKPLINEEDFIEKKLTQESLAPFFEWEKCAKNSGRYLLFTSLIGIADDGGWELCKANHSEDKISVAMNFDNNIFLYKFDKENFKTAILETRLKIDSFLKNNPSFVLEPSNIVFPESEN
ncbi:hypothetical protein AVMA1855_06890 [Acidovorax sp. SUPP1855]|uniref:hypothetical protein n=1 Tax=Acidovorax sp. SUPP1855 TaxID=431774 RepID=UPI0023DE6657|nr:hypothetical protein [Acidovorax sp. SUPP1855]GKS83852.1 hypothetical protein AVMA1855_06890 [Acidovorax sp. SUPP1855]